MTDGLSEERKDEGTVLPWTTIDDATLILHSFEKGIITISDTSLLSLSVSLKSLSDEVNNECKNRKWLR